MRALVEGMLEASVRVAGVFLDALFGRTPTAREERRARVLGRRAALTVWRLRRAYEAAAGDGQALEALRELQQILPGGERIRRAIMAWSYLLETVVQEAERRYGAKPGQGAFKAQQVKSAVVHLLIDQQLPVRDAPAFLHPLLIEGFVEFSIDSIVLVLNRHELWADPPPEGVGVPFRARVLQAIRRAWRWVWELPLMVRVSNWLRGLVRSAVLAGHPLTPAMHAALDQIRREGLLNVDDLSLRVRELVLWLRRHRRRLVALIELITIATEEAEVFQDMSGPQKKEYARALIKAFLREYDLAPAEGSLAAMVMEYVIDWGIEGVVTIFHKRGVFPQHRRTAAA